MKIVMKGPRGGQPARRRRDEGYMECNLDETCFKAI